MSMPMVSAAGEKIPPMLCRRGAEQCCLGKKKNFLFFRKTVKNFSVILQLYNEGYCSVKTKMGSHRDRPAEIPATGKEKENG